MGHSLTVIPQAKPTKLDHESTPSTVALGLTVKTTDPFVSNKHYV